ncbi:DUF2958 domain-containing protein [Sphingobium limneticum]|uniref:DUF2958 domain-containing protein n=1 Tax=Sphingobium limneticum TaxID=1007511 RepID=A0A5J5I3U7_9SPHN|nr:DUF2958 domain-containing protein [Sphingobium limneticum]KAA9018291.1 DUF2958 domain-containing protein [Sphingobium limneticum]KAA9030927.1 DUF2958 domain-containing protein [Sphingobium limneticum]
MEWTKHIRPNDLQQLIINWEEQLPLKGTSGERDYMPVIKLFNPVGAGTWLITECDNDGLAFGLSDLGYPELGYISLEEVFSVRLAAGLMIEQDVHFAAKHTLSEYAALAREKGHITA